MPYIAIEHDLDAVPEPLDLPSHQVKQLFDIAQAGAVGSVGSLRDFLGTAADIHLNYLAFIPVSVLLERIRQQHRNALGFQMRFSGDISGEIFTFFKEQEAFSLVEKMLGTKRRSHQPLNPLELSVLAELVNIISNSFWRVMADQADLNWWFSPPTRLRDPNRTLTYSAKVRNYDHLIIHFEFLIPSFNLRFQYIILPTHNSIHKLLHSLGRSIIQEADV
jgi:chemotaxis protein CheY-P-specific phosphatase CheC